MCIRDRMICLEKCENTLDMLMEEDLLNTLSEIAKDGDKVLVKGSRGMKMETIVEMLLR